MFSVPDGAELGAYFALPRVRGVTVSGAGYLLEVDQPRPGGAGWRPTVWAGRFGDGPPRPAFLGRQVSACGHGRVAYLARSAAEPRRDALWRRDPGGRADEIAAPAGGVVAFRVARCSGDLVYATRAYPGCGVAGDRQLRGSRAAAAVDAVLFDGGDPACSPGGDGTAARLVVVRAHDGCRMLPEPPAGRLTGGFDVTADGERVVAERLVAGRGGTRVDLVVAERHAGGWRWRSLCAETGVSFTEPAFSPDGRLVSCARTEAVAGAPEPLGRRLWLTGLDGCGRPLAGAFDGWPLEVVWAPDGERLYFTADRDGSRPVYAVNLAGDAVRRLTAVGAYDRLTVAGGSVYAVRSAIDAPPAPVRLDPDAPPGRRGPFALPSPLPAPAVPGVLERVSVRAADGRRVPGWLCRPPGGPAPLQVWLHGGPYATWAAWSWRWNPWLAVDRGYAVLMPDPTPSTGYGRAFVVPAWRDWSGPPASDVLSLSDAVRRRPDIDDRRAAVLGASFGGYLVNLLVTRTDRFRAAVSHAGMWDLRAFLSGSLAARPFVAEFGHPVDGADGPLPHSPRAAAAAVRTPMLISHGDRDAKVPVTEALTQWSDLRHLGKPVRLLRLPGEGHEITGPGNQQVWWQCVFAFLDHTLNGVPFRAPELLQARTPG
nr:prolyl oligopeptidase family serine peptidase [uncultured Actinoplanes sp.]